MTRNQFKEIVENRGFDQAILKLQEERDDIVNYEELKDFAIHEIANDYISVAADILDCMDTNDDWYRYDRTLGLANSPVPLFDIEDVEEYIGFDEED